MAAAAEAALNRSSSYAKGGAARRQQEQRQRERRDSTDDHLGMSLAEASSSPSRKHWEEHPQLKKIRGLERALAEARIEAHKRRAAHESLKKRHAILQRRVKGNRVCSSQRVGRRVAECAEVRAKVAHKAPKETNPSLPDRTHAPRAGRKRPGATDGQD